MVQDFVHQQHVKKPCKLEGSVAIFVPGSSPSQQLGFGHPTLENRKFSANGHMDVSKNSGTPKWMVFLMENPIKMDDFGVPPFSETPIETPTIGLITTSQLVQDFFS